MWLARAPTARKYAGNFLPNRTAKHPKKTDIFKDTVVKTSNFEFLPRKTSTQIELGPTIRDRTADTTLEVITNLDAYFLRRWGPTWATASSFLRFLDHTQRHTTVGRTSLDEWSACRRDLYVTKHHIHNRQTTVSPVRLEPVISAGERRKTLIKIGRNKLSVGAYPLANFSFALSQKGLSVPTTTQSIFFSL